MKDYKKNGALFLAAALVMIAMLAFPTTAEAKRTRVVKKRSALITKTMYVGDTEPVTVKVKNARNLKKTLWRVITPTNAISKVKLQKNHISFYASSQVEGTYEVCAFRVIKKTKKKIYFRMIPIRVIVKHRTAASSANTTTASKKATTTASKKVTTTASKKATTTASKKTTTTVSSSASGRSGLMYGKYGVFLGINGNQISKLDGYDTVVIEPEEFTAAQVTSLKKKGKTVLAYLNVGAIEKNRSYYKSFKKITLGAYDGWPDERWINVANVNWQNYVVNTLARKYIGMGFQGFYVDNLDVYYHYETDAIYNGCLSILKRLMAFKRIIMVNGGDVLVRKLISAGTVKNYMNVVNQEEVFSTNSGDTQDSEDTKYFKEYLALAKKAGLKCCLLEYGRSSTVFSRIQNYAKQNGFLYYYSPNKNLD